MPGYVGALLAVVGIIAALLFGYLAAVERTPISHEADRQESQVG